MMMLRHETNFLNSLGDAIDPNVDPFGFSQSQRDCGA